MSNGIRRWISREEIAQIHDTRAERMIDKANAAADAGDLETMSKCLVTADTAQKAAQTYREIDAFPRRVG